MRFAEANLVVGAKKVRTPFFASRSTLPLQAVCLVANGIREQLARLLARDFDLDVLEPIIPTLEARHVLFGDAFVYRVRGGICDVFIVLRSLDARRIIAAAFGESDRPEHGDLSDIERTTLERIIAAVVPLCTPLCAHVGGMTHEAAERAEIETVTYFEVRTSGENPISIGFALTRDPPEEPTQRLQMEHLLEVEVSARVVCARGRVPFSSFANLECGTTIALQTRLEGVGTLRVGDLFLGNGTCGSRDGRNAFVLGAM